MLNIVSTRSGIGFAVFDRGIRPIDSLALNLAGYRRACRTLRVYQQIRGIPYDFLVCRPVLPIFVCHVTISNFRLYTRVSHFPLDFA